MWEVLTSSAYCNYELLLFVLPMLDCVAQRDLDEGVKIYAGDFVYSPVLEHGSMPKDQGTPLGTCSSKLATIFGLQEAAPVAAVLSASPYLSSPTIVDFPSSAEWYYVHTPDKSTFWAPENECSLPPQPITEHEMQTKGVFLTLMRKYEAHDLWDLNDMCSQFFLSE